MFKKIRNFFADIESKKEQVLLEIDTKKTEFECYKNDLEKQIQDMKNQVQGVKELLPAKIESVVEYYGVEVKPK